MTWDAHPFNPYSASSQSASSPAHPPQITAAIAHMAEQFTQRFPVTTTQPRVVGREAEYPVVDSHGRAADVRRLWEPLMARGDLTPKTDGPDSRLIVGLEGTDYSYALEVGVGTVEVNTRPLP